MDCLFHKVCSEVFDSVIFSESFLNVKVTSSAKMVHMFGGIFHFGSHFRVREI
jgi:hypothetical protein